MNCLELVIKVVSKVTGVSGNNPNFTKKVQNLIFSVRIMRKIKILNEIYNNLHQRK